MTSVFDIHQQRTGTKMAAKYGLVLELFGLLGEQKVTLFLSSKRRIRAKLLKVVLLKSRPRTSTSWAASKAIQLARKFEDSMFAVELLRASKIQVEPKKLDSVSAYCADMGR